QGSDGTPKVNATDGARTGRRRPRLAPPTVKQLYNYRTTNTFGPRDVLRPEARSALLLLAFAPRPPQQLRRIRLEGVPPDAVVDVLPFPPGLHQAGGHELLHMVGNGSLGDREHRPQPGAGALPATRDRLQQGHPPRIGECLADQDELRLGERRPGRG